MSRYLFYTYPAIGDTYPLVPMMQMLEQRGHDVTVYTVPSQLDRLTRLGLKACPLDSRLVEAGSQDWHARTASGRMLRILDAFAQKAPTEAADLSDAIDRERPDCIVVHSHCFGAAAVAEAQPTPWAQVAPFLLPIPSDASPPFGLGLPPRNDLFGRARDTTVGALSRLSYRSAFRKIEALRTSLGVPTPAIPTDLYLRAPLLLACTAPPFEYERPDWPSSVRMIGPCVWDPPDESIALLGKLGGEPLVLVTVSTHFQNDSKLLQAALWALADENVEVVATAGDYSVDRFQIPANARVESFLPHGPILERAACVVCHGGCGITQKALARGVPVCVVPFGRDQHEVARRVEQANAGVRLPPRQISTSRLRTAVRQTIGKRQGAERVAAAFSQLDGGTLAADALEAACRRDIARVAGL